MPREKHFTRIREYFTVIQFFLLTGILVQYHYSYSSDVKIQAKGPAPDKRKIYQIVVLIP